MTNKELFYFTGKCLMLDEDPGFKLEIINKIEAGSIDWLKFSAFCSDHFVLPVIYLKFQANGVTEYLPEEFSEYLKYIYDLNLTRNTEILEQIRSITVILNKNEIYPVFLKGAGNLLDGLYSTIGERILGDIDFLVPEKDFLLSGNLFEAEGYLQSEPFLYMEINTWRHYPRLFKPGLAEIEIHHKLSRDQQSWFNTGVIDQEKITVATLKGCYVLSDKHKIIHNFTHCQLDHEGHIYNLISFRDLYDLYLLSKRTDIQQTLPDIKCKQKAIAYFKFAGIAFGLPYKFYPRANFSAWLFTIKHDLNLCSPTFYYTNRSVIYLVKRIIIGQTAQIIMAFYSKSVRQTVIWRLKDRKWYRSRLQTYIDFFARNKK
jgi:hypothetical protein